MVQRMAWSLTNYIVKRNIVEADDDEIYAYGFECIIANAIQTAALVTLALVFWRPVETLLYVLSFTSLKQRIGGWHSQTHFSCITVFTLCTASSYLAADYLSGWPALAMAGVAAILVLLKAPVVHYNNPKTEEQIAQARRAALLVTAIEAAAVLTLFLLPIPAKFSFYGAYGFFMASITLIIPIRGEVPQ